MDFFKDRKEYKATKSLWNFSASFTSIAVFIVMLITQHILWSRDSSPVLLQAGNDGGFNGAWFEFREDGTYKFTNSGGIGATILRGTYQLKDSIITLDTSDLDGAVRSKLLAIRQDIEVKRVKGELPAFVIYQINKQHRITDKDLAFIIHEDHRKVRL